MPFTERFDRAFALAHELHRNQERKGTSVPYIVHLMSVAALACEYGGTEDQTIAALLHDAVEDQGGEPTAQRILSGFGPDVHRMVMALSDSVASNPAQKLPWKARKESYLEHLKSSPPDVRLVSAADKVHNVRSLIADLRILGPAVWSKFKGGRDGSLWYYESMVTALREGWDHPLADLLDREVRELVSLAAA